MKTKQTILISILGLLASAFVGLGLFLFSRGFSFPSGVDGYYYIKQFKYFSQTSSLYFQDHSVAYVLPFSLRLILKNELLVYQICTSLVLCLLIYSQFLLARFFLPDIRKTSWLYAALAFAFCALNISAFELAMNFYKNTFSLMIFSFGFLFYLYFLKKGRKGYLITSLFFFIVCLLSHKSAAIGLGCVLTSSFVIFYEKLPNKILAGLGILALAIAAVFLFFFQNAGEFVRVSLQSLVLNEKYPVWLYGLGINRDFLFLGYCLEWIVIAALILQLRREKNSTFRFIYLFYILFLIVTVLPIYKSNEEELGYRLLLSTTALLGPAFVLLWRNSQRSFSVSEFALGVLLIQFMYSSPLKSNFTDYTSMDEAMPKLKEIVKPEDYLIAHHGLEFYVDYKTDIRARIFLPEPDFQGSIYRVVYVPYGSLKWIQAKTDIARVQLLSLNKEYYLVKQSDWESIKKKLELPEIWKNPSLVNPGHVYH